MKSLNYLDGSANEYELKYDESTGNCTFEYKPITPMQSSSGTYSGGSPVFKTIPQSQWNEYVTLFSQAFQAPSNEISSSRVMGSGVFIVVDGEKSNKIILTMSSHLHDTLRKELKKLR